MGPPGTGGPAHAGVGPGERRRERPRGVSCPFLPENGVKGNEKLVKHPANVSRVSAEPAGAATPDLIRQVRHLVDDARRIVVLTGAGISTDSGIPDFRGPQGLWTKDPKAERTSDIAIYVADPEVRRPWPGRARLRPPGVGRRAQRRSPGARRPRAAGQPAAARHPEHRRPAPAGRVRPAPWWSRCTAPSTGWCACSATPGGPWRTPSTGCGRATSTRSARSAAASSSPTPSRSVSRWSRPTSSGRFRAAGRGRPAARRRQHAHRVPDRGAARDRRGRRRAGGGRQRLADAVRRPRRRGAPRPHLRDPAGAPGLTGRRATV